MKRRVISLLAILVMLCTMVVVVAPTATAAEWDSYPAFSTYEDGTSYRDWKISTKADWDKLIEVANAASGDYLSGHTLHMANNLEYGGNVYPVGWQNKTGGFAGTLNGHGFGIGAFAITVKKVTQSNQEVLVFKDEATSSAYGGLFYNLSNCQIIDFGLNENSMILDTLSVIVGGVSSFGRVLPKKTPKFTRVWSSAALGAMQKGYVCGLVHTAGENNKITVDVNGFVFDGDLIKTDDYGYDGQWSYAVSGSTLRTLSSGNSFANVIVDCASRNGTMKISSGTYTVTKAKDDQGVEKDPGVRTALFNFDTVANFKAANKGNLYAVKRAEDGVDEGYFLSFRSGYGASGSEEIMTDMSAAEVAWTINNNQISGKEAVYYTLKDGKVRPIAEGAQTGKIVKVTLTGARNESYFVNSGIEVNLEEKLGKKAGQTFKVDSDDITGATYTFTADTTIAVTASCGSNHTYDANSYVQGENEHTATCTVCGVKTVEPCSADSYAQTTITNQKLSEGQSATHTGKCKYCGANFKQECSYTYTRTNIGNSYWQFNCVCGRNNKAGNPNVRDMLAGDVNLNNTVDASDAICLLKKLAGMTVSKYNERNANLSGNSKPQVSDSRRIILYWMGQSKWITEFAKFEKKANKTNYYDATKTVPGNLKMDGDVGTNDRYVTTENIAVTKGDKVLFGPVRMQQAVMGCFYKKDGTLLAVINRNNDKLEIEYKFADGDGKITADNLKDKEGTVCEENPGMVMAYIRAPKDAAYVRFNVNAEEKDKYYIRLNNDFNSFEYEESAKAEIDDLGNPLKNQFVLNMGDSLSDGAGNYPFRDPTPDGRLTCWSRRTKQQFGAKVVTSAQGGSTVSTIKITSASVDTRQCILNQLNEHTGIGRQYEYILLEGGGNDCNGNAALGFDKDVDGDGKNDIFHPTSYDPQNFAPENTYAGGLERMIYTAIREHGDTAAFGYFIPYDMKHVTGSYGNLTGAGEYFELGKQICEKWGVEYLDLFNISAEDSSGNLTGTFSSKMNTEKFKEYVAGKAEDKAVEKAKKEGLTGDALKARVEELVAQAVAEEVAANAEHISDDGMTYDGVHAIDAGHDIMFSYIKPFMLKMKPASVEAYAATQEYGALPTSYKNY